MTRLEVHEKLCEILGSRNVYFQPPASVAMRYPAIVYSLGKIDNTFANNDVYRQTRSYEITIIDKDPDSKIVDRVSLMPKFRFDRRYTSDNLYHNVFTLNY